MRRWGTFLLTVALATAACSGSSTTGSTPSTSQDLSVTSALHSTTSTLAAEAPAGTVVLGDRVIELDSVGCLRGPEGAPYRLYAFGDDQDALHYAVGVEEYLVEVRALADEGIVAASRFAPTWAGAAVEGTGEFRVDGGLAEPLAGSLQAECPAAGLESGWAVDETGLDAPLPAGVVCVDSGTTFSFAAGEQFQGLHTTDSDLVTHHVTRYPDAFGPVELAEIVLHPDVAAVVEFVELAGFGELDLGGYESALLLPGQPSPIFTTPIPADRFSITADVDYLPALYANPRQDQQQLVEAIDRYGDVLTVDMEVTCAVSLTGPPGATVADLVQTASLDRAMALPGGATGVPPTPAAVGQISRPRFELATDEAYDFDEIPTYAESHDAVYDYIDARLDDHLADIQRWLRQPSISAENTGIQEMAEMVRQDLADLGFAEAEMVPTDGHPGVWGYYDAGADKTLLVYLMYDVQPAAPEEWDSPPFAAELVDNEAGTVVMARGATNQKGPERAFLNALESIIAVDGKLPVNIMITAEGEEELGSPNYPQIVDAYEERLRTADAVLFPANAQLGGGVFVELGAKGIIYFEITARGGSWGGPSDADIHGSLKALVDSPVWRLLDALSTLVTPDGNTILVPGYYDDIRPPNQEESLLINAGMTRWSDRAWRSALDVNRWIDGMSGREAVIEYLYGTTLNINGIFGGEAQMTIVPHEATAHVDSRLPPGMDPDEAMAKIRAHLDGNGFTDIEIRQTDGYPASHTSVEAPQVQTALSVYKKYDDIFAVHPWSAGSAPFYQFTERLGLPLVAFGLGFGFGAHGPNEYMVIEPGPGVDVAGLDDIEKAYVDLIHALARQSHG